MNRIPPLVAVAASVLLLSGCWLTPSTPTGTDESPASPSPAPSATDDAVEEPEAPSDVLFTITAGTTDDTGAPVTITMTGHAPQHWDAAGRESVKNDFIAQCGALGGGSVWEIGAPLTDATLAAYGSTLMVIDVESTPAGRTVEPIDLLAGSFYYQQVGTGAVAPVAELPGCSGSRLVSTGSATLITDYESGQPTGDLAQWLTGSYGFTAAYGSSTTFTSCTATLTPLAATYPLSSLPGWDVTQSTATQCWTGYQGE